MLGPNLRMQKKLEYPPPPGFLPRILRHVRIQRGERGSGSPGKSQVIWVSLKINIRKKLDPLPLENSGPTLDPLKSIVFSVIKPLDPLC